jgi:polysaccharide biosynthesis PFTS motif protein
MSINFIKNILSAMANFNWDIVLKPKRAYNKSHSKKYISYINEQTILNKNFRVTEPTLDMIDEITQSDLIISIPLTSPFELAKFLKIPTYYMDPTGTIDFEKMAYTSNDYIADTEALIEVVRKLN